MMCHLIVTILAEAEFKAKSYIEYRVLSLHYLENIFLSLNFAESKYGGARIARGGCYTWNSSWLGVPCEFFWYGCSIICEYFLQARQESYSSVEYAAPVSPVTLDWYSTEMQLTWVGRLKTGICDTNPKQKLTAQTEVGGKEEAQH